jgi:hypothetical protein
MNGVDTLRGIHGLRTMGSSKKRSISRVHNSAYLDLYMMEAEEVRLVKESKRLEMRHNQIKQRLKEIAEYRETAHRNTAKKPPVPVAEEEASPKIWKKVSMNY